MLQGSIVALVTPFTDDLEVDHAALGELVDLHVACETAAVIPCGTTGEAATLSGAV